MNSTHSAWGSAARVFADEKRFSVSPFTNSIIESMSWRRCHGLSGIELGRLRILLRKGPLIPLCQPPHPGGALQQGD